MTAAHPIDRSQSTPLRRPSVLPRVALTLLGALALLWPAYVNGGPFWFPDTSNYVRAADAGVVFLTGSPSEWSDRLEIAAPGQAPAAVSGANSAGDAQAAPEIAPTRPVLVGRSIYYGFLLYLPMRLFGPWGAVFLQALIVAGVLVFAAGLIRRELGALRRPVGAILAGVLLIASPLPFFTAMLMPDVYSGLLVLCLATVITLWGRLRAAERIALIAICAVITTFHTTHILIALAMGLVAAVFALGGAGRLRPILLTLPVAAVGMLSVVAFNAAVTHALGQPPVSPPFLSARVTDAGPGTAYLKERCGDPDVAFVLCRYKERLPVHSDSFLWDENPATGVYQVFDDAERARVSREDVPFFLAVFAHDPLALIGVSLQSFAELLVSFDLKGFNLIPEEAGQLYDKYPPGVAQAIEETLAARQAMPLTPVIVLTIAATVASLAAIVLAFAAGRRYPLSHSKPIGSWVLLVLLGVAANAFICGAMSGPHGRYQMRLIWLLPAAAAAALPLRSAGNTKRNDGVANPELAQTANLRRVPASR